MRNSKRRSCRPARRDRNVAVVEALEPRVLLSYTWINELNPTTVNFNANSTINDYGTALQNILNSDSNNKITDQVTGQQHYLQYGDTIVLARPTSPTLPQRRFHASLQDGHGHHHYSIQQYGLAFPTVPSRRRLPGCPVHAQARIARRQLRHH